MTNPQAVQRAQDAYRTAEKLRILLDPDVQKFFDDQEAALTRAILAVASKPGDDCRILALRLQSFREVRQFVEGAANAKTNIEKRLTTLINLSNAKENDNG